MSYGASVVIIMIVHLGVKNEYHPCFESLGKVVLSKFAWLFRYLV